MVAGMLKEQGLSFQVQEDYLLIPKIAEEALFEQIKSLLNKGARIIRIEEKSKNLEDIFLEITGTAVSL